MTDDLERAVARHYGSYDLAERILRAVAAAGLDPARLRHEDLAPIDEFHIGGRAATAYALAKISLKPGDRVLDIGCGIGGATRYLAATFGCHVTGIDLTPEYIGAAQMLAERTGLADRVSYRIASALDLPFEDHAFDAAITLHVAMNIQDRPRLYAETARVLKAGAPLCLYDIVQGPSEGLHYPVPWAATPATSHLVTLPEMRTLLERAGFDIVDVEDRTDYAIAFIRERLAAAARGPAPPLGLHLVIGESMPEKFRNLLEGLEGGCVAPVVMIARRTASRAR